ncbi:U3 small nucleolar RNA-associated protein 6 homolog isoform X2 [Camellia sinensis]|uniref:U3 small nucleolar RNA-associated protein 6 homolog isoform X1 n=1 Tax=Camellia sinensis TaxID=4442 RepID=UPI0010365FC6|nr:U3 small nucleolar RNA-associated protein 6 homolog isoform X1 [Camellia sinensis]XP_028093979.1 U3 small nucleolar RNA-associated protein 6 homolog isoform X2 [Camellia sinensis]
MADVVQYKLERMVDELNDLECRGLFSRREIAEIVKQRRKFEYRLKRPSPLKQDFIAYIDYEKQLEALRLLRKKAVARELKKQNKKMKKSVSDFAGVSRILEIYRLATNRFKGDIELWFQYLEFCRERKNGRMKKVLAQLIRFHPKVPGVWIYAAAWEFDHNLNAAAARALMQSGLRSCTTSGDLWVEYLRMELTYLNKLKARKVALGEDEGSLIRDHRDADEKQWRDENKELFMVLDEKRENDKESNVQNGESNKKLDLFQEHGLSILRTVYSGAVEALPSSFSLRTRFIEILEATDLAHSEEMLNEILADMKRDFSKEPEYWDWLARLETTDSKSTQKMGKEIMPCQLEKAIQVYEEAIKVLPSAIMFTLYTRFLKDAIVHKNEETQSSGVFSPDDHTKDPISCILMVYERAESMGCITEDLACQHVSFYLQLRRLEEARKLAEKLCNGKLSDAVDLWVLRLSIEMRCVTEKSSSPSKADVLPVFELLKNVLKEMIVRKAESLWIMALKFFSNQRYYFDKLVEISLVSLAKDGGSDDGFSLSSAIVNFVLQKDGIQCARDTYKRFLALPRPGLALYKNCIELETNLASAGDRDCLLEVRKLYESVLATYEQDVSLWKSYYSMETKMGTSETANAVYWRAQKLLKDKVAHLSSAFL